MAGLPTEIKNAQLPSKEDKEKKRRTGTVHQQPSVEEMMKSLKVSSPDIRRRSEPWWENERKQSETVPRRSQSEPVEEFSQKQVLTLYDDPLCGWLALLQYAEGSVLRNRPFNDTFNRMYDLSKRCRFTFKSVEEQANDEKKNGNFVRAFILLIWASELYSKYCGPKLRLTLSHECLKQLKAVAVCVTTNQKSQDLKKALHTNVILPSLHNIAKDLENLTVRDIEIKKQKVVNCYNCISQYCKEYGDIAAAKATYNRCEKFVNNINKSGY